VEVSVAHAGMQRCAGACAIACTNSSCRSEHETDARRQRSRRATRHRESPEVAYVLDSNSSALRANVWSWCGSRFIFLYGRRRVVIEQVRQRLVDFVMSPAVPPSRLVCIAYSFRWASRCDWS
jgi:hypothetical protein